MRRTLIGLAALVLAVAATTAQAEPTARQKELAHRYMLAAHLDKNMEATVQAVTPTMLAGLPKGNEAQQARQAAVMEVMPEVMRNFASKLAAGLEPVIAETFTEQELEAIVKFYETPIGQSVIQKSPLLAQHMAPMMKELMPEMQRDLVTKVCAKIDCTAGGNAAPPAAK